MNLKDLSAKRMQFLMPEDTKALALKPKASPRKRLLRPGVSAGLFVFILTTSAFALEASWYSVDSLIKEGTYAYSKGVMANGDIFKDEALTCASWDYKLGTVLLVRNRQTGKVVKVVVTDRTARRFKGKRIDLSKRAFRKIARLEQGIVQVSITAANRQQTGD